MTNTCVLMYHLLVMCVLLEKSIVLSSCRGYNYISCNEFPTNSRPDLSCHIYPRDPNATIIRNALSSCTVGKPYQRVYLSFDGYDLELQLDLGDNVTELLIDLEFNGHLYINPFKQHTNLTYLTIWEGYWETRGLILSEYFPNLKMLYTAYEFSISTFNNLLINLTSLTDLSWLGGSLTSISVDEFRGLSSLSYIDLSSNFITYLASELFQDLPNLKKLLVSGGLNCTCQLQLMSIVDRNGWVDIVGSCKVLRVDHSVIKIDSTSTYIQCHNTESYQCFNKSISCDNVCINTQDSYMCACDAGYGLTLLEAEEACRGIVLEEQGPVAITYVVISVLLTVALIIILTILSVTCMGCIYYYQSKSRSQSESFSQPKISKDKSDVVFGSDEGNQHISIDPEDTKRDVSPSVYPGNEPDCIPMVNREPEVPPHYLNVN